MIRISAILATVLAVLMTVAVLRVEITRMHHQLAALDLEAVELWQSLRSKDVELARLRNPILIRQRVANLRLEGTAAAETDGN